MSKTKEVLRRTGKYSREERATYLLQYRFDLGDRFHYADQEAVDGQMGHIFIEMKNGSFMSGSNSALDQGLRKMIEENKFEKGEYKKVIEYEADYE